MKKIGMHHIAVWLLAATCTAQAPGPMTPPAKREIKRIPMEKGADAPPVPAEEILKRATEKEAEFARAYRTYSFQQTVRVQEFNPEGGVAGEYQVTTEIVAGGGRREERLARQSSSTLKSITLGPEDLEELARLAVFWLTPEEVAKYELTYVGQQQLDEVSTYAFRIVPRRLARRVRMFEGLIWVDDRQFEIVKTFGRFVAEVTDDAQGSTFAAFETIREGIDNKYRFPSYCRSDGEVKRREGSVRLRLTMRATQFKKAE